MILKDMRVGRVIKLHEGDDPGGLLGLALSDARPHTNVGKMSCRVVVSTQGADRSNDVVVSKGIDLTDHRRLPVVLLNHNRDYPVGYAEDQLGSYTVRLDGDTRLVAESFFSKSTKIGEQAFRLVEDGVLRGASIGFLPVGTVEKSHAGGRLFGKSRLCEYSHLVLPDNPEAVVIAVEKGFGGKALCPELLNILTPYAPARPAAVVGGFTPDPVHKAMPQDPRDTLQGGASPPDPMDPNTPVEGADDPNAVDPSASPPDADDHKGTVDQAVADMMASWYTQLCDGKIDSDKFKEMMSHLADTRDVHAAGAVGGEDDGEGNLDDLSEDDDTDGDETDDDSSADCPADLNDDDKERAEKMCRLVWMKGYAGAMSRVADDLGHVLAYPNLDPRKAQTFLRKTLQRMTTLPSFDTVVQKALKASVVHVATEDDVDWGPVAGAIQGLTNRIETIAG